MNGNLLTANLKGLKKKPGTAPPADLGTGVRLGVGSQNKVEMIYVNSQQPVQHKVSAAAALWRRSLTLCVEILPDCAAGRDVLRRVGDREVAEGQVQEQGGDHGQEYVASGTTLHNVDICAVVQTGDDDDDIVAGPQKMSLKCPVSAAVHQKT